MQGALETKCALAKRFRDMLRLWGKTFSWHVAATGFRIVVARGRRHDGCSCAARASNRAPWCTLSFSPRCYAAGCLAAHSAGTSCQDGHALPSCCAANFCSVSAYNVVLSPSCILVRIVLDFWPWPCHRPLDAAALYINVLWLTRLGTCFEGLKAFKKHGPPRNFDSKDFSL